MLKTFSSDGWCVQCSKTQNNFRIPLTTILKILRKLEWPKSDVQGWSEDSHYQGSSQVTGFSNVVTNLDRVHTWCVIGQTLYQLVDRVLCEELQTRHVPVGARTRGVPIRVLDDWDSPVKGFLEGEVQRDLEKSDRKSQEADLPTTRRDVDDSDTSEGPGSPPSCLPLFFVFP